MNLRSIRNWLLRGTKPRNDPAQDDPRLIIESPELRRLLGTKLAELTSELRLANAIESALINERHAADEDGEPVPRVFVTCPALRGMFLFSAEETERRIRNAFPDLDSKAVKASVRHLADRVAASITAKTLPRSEARRSYVRDWAADSDEFFRL